MKLAIKKAYSTGVGIISVQNSNNFCEGSYYVNMAVENNCIGMAFTNTEPLVVPTGAKSAALGTNSITIGAGGTTCTEFLLDMSTSIKTIDAIQQAAHLNKTLHKHWALDKLSNPTTDPQKALEVTIHYCSLKFCNLVFLQVFINVLGIYFFNLFI